MKQQSGVHHLIITPAPALSSAVSLVTVTKGWCHNSHNSHISHNTLVTNTPRLGRGCRLLTAEEERWPALMRTEQRPQEEGNYCSGGQAVSVSPSYPIGPLHYTLLCPPPGPLHYTLLTQFRQEAPLTLRLLLAGAWLSHVLHGWHSRE